jgi:hypothetical protein
VDKSICASVLERFPVWSEQISQLLQTDAVFCEMCADYEELANWFAAHSHDGCTPEPDCAANRQLLAELEIEISQNLQAVDHQPGHQA